MSNRDFYQHNLFSIKALSIQCVNKWHLEYDHSIVNGETKFITDIQQSGLMYTVLTELYLPGYLIPIIC